MEIEDVLKQSENMYRMLFESSLVGVYLIKIEGEIIACNDAGARSLGFNNGKDIVGMNICDFYKKKNDREKLIEKVNNGSAENFEVDFITNNGSIITALISSSLVDYQGEKVILSNCIDITKQKKNNTLLKESEERYRKLVESSPEAIVVHSMGKIIFANPVAVKLFGAEYSGQIIGRPINDFVNSDYYNTNNKIFKNGKSGYITEEKFIQLNGNIIDVEVAIAPIIYIGDPATQVVFRNITERKRTEEALRRSENKYSTLVENSRDCIVILQDRKIQFVNKVSYDLTGYSPEEIIGNDFVNILHPDQREISLKRYNDIKDGKSVQDVIEYIIIKKDGVKLSVEVDYSGNIEFEGKTAELIFVRDISKRKNTEEENERLEMQLRQAQRMEAIGTLAGGIAHDFNNLLMGILGCASLLMLNTDPDSNDYEHINGIEKYVKSAANLTNQLLGFARGGKYEPKVTVINELIKSTSEMFGRTRKEITIYSKLNDDLWSADVDQGQIEQVLLNIYVNAWQAMPGGGNLYLQTENICLDENYIKPFQLKHGKYIKITITDTGIGMDKETQQRIFEPFFTTKEMGRGTGLGLASVYGIIKNHGGFINVDSEKGEGSTFSIYLPATEQKETKELTYASEILEGIETILLIDDEALILDVTEKILKKMGYYIITSSSGDEAIEIYKEHKDQIDIVILDMIMPGMSGSEVFDILKNMNPDVKVLLSTGYSIEGQAREIIDRGCKGFIQKPFDMLALSQKIRDILKENSN